MFRNALALFGVLFAIPILGLVALAFTKPITPSGIGYLLGASLAISGLIIAPWSRHYYWVTLAGILVVALVAGARLFLARQDNKTSQLNMIVLPQGRDTRWISSLVDEQDSLIFGEALFHLIGGDTANEHEGISDALASGYAEMGKTQGVVPSPVFGTYLGLQQPASFDAVIIQPKVRRQPDVAIVFLHGYMGNVTLQCWEIAQAVQEFGAITVCPSTDWRGAWWEPEGEAILQSTFDYVRAQGIQRIYLGGFSNGGFGISRLAANLKEEKDLRGLFLINGASNGTAIRELGLPVLILQGTQDERVPASSTRQVTETIGNLATYVEVQGDHFIIIKQSVLVQNAISNWLGNLDK